MSRHERPFFGALMIPYDTILAEFTRLFGNETLAFLVSTIYPSAVFKLIIFGSAVGMFIYTGLSLHRGRLHKYVIIFWTAWISMLPAPDKPLYFVFVKNVSTALVKQLQKSTFDLFSKFGTNNTYPPGFVAETLMKAATTKITDKNLSYDVTNLIDNCVPYGNITEKDGSTRPINASDLFQVRSSGLGQNVDSLQLSFDSSLLKNREVLVKKDTIDCHSYLFTTLHKLYDHAKPKSSFFNFDFFSWDKPKLDNSNLSKTAINLAAASAIQSQVINKYLGSDLNYHGKSILDSNITPLIALQNQTYGTLSPSRHIFNVMSVPQTVIRSLNTEDYFDNLGRLKQLNNKHLNLPYYVSCIIVFLTIIFVFVVITPFITGSFKFVFIWTTAYVVVLIIPWVLMILRSICNIILIHSLNIDKHSNVLSSDPSFLKYGIDFSSVSNILHDSSRLISVYLSTELAICGGITALPFLYWGAAGLNSGGSVAAAQTANKGVQIATQLAATKLGPVKSLLVSKAMPNSKSGMEARNNVVENAKGMRDLEMKDRSNKAWMQIPANKKYLNNLRNLL